MVSTHSTNESVYSTNMITKEQVKMGRAALAWGVRDLAEKAGVTANTISRFENGADAMASTLQEIEKALIKAGVIFIPADSHGGAGVRLKK